MYKYLKRDHDLPLWSWSCEVDKLICAFLGPNLPVLQNLGTLYRRASGFVKLLYYSFVHIQVNMEERVLLKLEFAY